MESVKLSTDPYVQKTVTGLFATDGKKRPFMRVSMVEFASKHFKKVLYTPVTKKQTKQKQQMGNDQSGMLKVMSPIPASHTQIIADPAGELGPMTQTQREIEPQQQTNEIVMSPPNPKPTTGVPCNSNDNNKKDSEPQFDKSNLGHPTKGIATAASAPTTTDCTQTIAAPYAEERDSQQPEAIVMDDEFIDAFRRYQKNYAEVMGTREQLLQRRMVSLEKDPVPFEDIIPNHRACFAEEDEDGNHVSGEPEYFLSEGTFQPGCAVNC